MLPPIYYEDSLAQRLTGSLDEVLSPVIAVLDNLQAYLDPWVAPMDFAEWLAGWVGIALDETWPADRQRALIGQAGELYRWRGTVRGLSALLALYVQTEPEIIETGGAAWSAVPGGEVPGEAVPHLKVVIRVPDPAAVDVAHIETVIRSAKPAGIPHEVEVVAG
jgi:phage tail-like protein